jgi:flagellar hook-associated protein 2
MFRSGGLASGLDTNSIVQQLVQIERIPISKLQQKKSAQQTQLSSIGKVKSALSDLIKQMKALDTTN